MLRTRGLRGGCREAAGERRKRRLALAGLAGRLGASREQGEAGRPPRPCWVTISFHHASGKGVEGSRRHDGQSTGKLYNAQCPCPTRCIGRHKKTPPVLALEPSEAGAKALPPGERGGVLAMPSSTLATCTAGRARQLSAVPPCLARSAQPNTPGYLKLIRSHTTKRRGAREHGLACVRRGLRGTKQGLYLFTQQHHLRPSLSRC